MQERVFFHKILFKYKIKIKACKIFWGYYE